MVYMHWLIVSVYAAILVVATLVPWGPPVTSISIIDAELHFAAWAALAFLVTVALRSGSRPSVGVTVVAAIGAISFGGLIEALQFLTGRSAEVIDLIADAIGATVGAGAGTVASWCTQQVARSRHRPR